MSRTTTLVLAAAVATFAACSQQRSSGGLSVSTHTTGASGTAPTTPSAPPGLTLPNGIEITHIRMAIRSVSVEGDDAEFACSTATTGRRSMMSPVASHGFDPGHAWTTAADDLDPSHAGSGVCHDLDPSHAGSGAPAICEGEEDHGHHGPEEGEDGNCRLAYGPYDVDLAGTAIAGKVSFAFHVPVPDGTYEEVAIDVNTVSSTAAGGNATLLALASAHASILVDGWVRMDASTSVPFTFSTPMRVQQKREGKIVIGDGSNVTLDFDPTHWFDGRSGRLDPNDPSDRGAILANIRASIRILKDDDHDGVDDDDHGGHGDHGKGGH